jgi:phage terminase large subunit
MWAYLETGGKRCDVVAHRRWGKDDVSLHWTAVAMHQRVGVYWHMLPEASQARKAIWDAVNPRTGKRRIDEAFPKELRATTKDQDMFIRFKNGSTWQVLGSDNFDSFVGSPPIGVIFSEWSIARPNGWNYVRPILLENGGWAVFIWTPRGRNHATRAFEARERDPEWFTARMPATVTPVFTPEQLAKEKQDLIDEAGSVAEGTAIFNSEYLVDFDSAAPGAYYATEMQTAITAGRVGEVLWTPGIKVDTMWDLGIDDYTAIWFSQRVAPTQVNFLAFYETSDIGFDDSGETKGIVSEAFRGDRYKAKWQYGMHYLPHDVRVRELGAGGRSRLQTLHGLGIKPIRAGIARDPEERIAATRKLLPYSHFDREHCQSGIDHMKQYRKRWNQSLGVFTGPLHNEHSHAADALGEGAVNMKLPALKTADKTPPPDGYTTNRKSMFNQGVPHWKVA